METIEQLELIRNQYVLDLGETQKYRPSDSWMQHDHAQREWERRDKEYEEQRPPKEKIAILQEKIAKLQKKIEPLELNISLFRAQIEELEQIQP